MRPLLIKICGNRNPEDSRFVAALRPDFMGWIFSPKSPRRVAPAQASRIISEIVKTHPQILHVGVFAGNSIPEIADIIRHGPGLDLLQVVEGSGFVKRVAALIRGAALPLRTGRTPRVFPVAPAVRISGETGDDAFSPYPPVPFFVLDAFDPDRPGGTGKRIRSEWIRNISRPYLLAGGLNPENVIEALRETNPIGVDVSSGLEKSPGRKDHRKVELFFERVRAYEKDR